MSDLATITDPDELRRALNAHCADDPNVAEMLAIDALVNLQSELARVDKSSDRYDRLLALHVRYLGKVGMVAGVNHSPSLAARMARKAAYHRQRANGGAPAESEPAPLPPTEVIIGRPFSPPKHGSRGR